MSDDDISLHPLPTGGDVTAENLQAYYRDGQATTSPTGFLARVVAFARAATLTHTATATRALTAARTSTAAVTHTATFTYGSAVTRTSTAALTHAASMAYTVTTGEEPPTPGPGTGRVLFAPVPAPRRRRRFTVAARADIRHTPSMTYTVLPLGRWLEEELLDLV